MSYTSHGHQIAGTPVEGVRPPVARCGGPAACPKCAKDAGAIRTMPEGTSNLTRDEALNLGYYRPDCYEECADALDEGRKVLTVNGDGETRPTLVSPFRFREYQQGLIPTVKMYPLTRYLIEPDLKVAAEGIADIVADLQLLQKELTNE